MVEEGSARGLTARFQSIQWTANYGASLLAGVVGGYLSAHVSYGRTFLLVALFPGLSLATSAWAVQETRTRFDRATVRATLAAFREGARWGRSGGRRRSSSSGTSARRSECRSSTTWWTSWESPRSSLACWRASRAAQRCSGRSRSAATRGGWRRAFCWNVAIAIGVGEDVHACYRTRGVVVGGGADPPRRLRFGGGAARDPRPGGPAVPRHAGRDVFAALMSVSNLGTTGGEWVGGRSRPHRALLGSSRPARLPRRHAGASCHGCESPRPGAGRHRTRLLRQRRRLLPDERVTRLRRMRPPAGADLGHRSPDSRSARWSRSISSSSRRPIQP